MKRSIIGYEGYLREDDCFGIGSSQFAITDPRFKVASDNFN